MKKLLYIQIAEDVMASIVRGDIKPGEKIVSVRDMSLEKKVNPKTVQKAFSYLDEKKIFDVIVGEGRYLTHDENILLNIKESVINAEISEFINKLSEYGYGKEKIISMIKEYNE